MEDETAEARQAAAVAPLLSVILPTFNEAQNIGPLIDALAAELKGTPHEILVVDDASTDGTAAAARDHGARVIVRHEEVGLATAVVRGLREARGKYAVVMDADFQHPVTAARRLLERARERDADIVIGSRYAADGGETGFGAARRIVSWGAGTIARVMLPPVRSLALTDPMSGLFLVRRDRIDLDRLRPRGYKILLEILARTKHLRVEEIGYVFGRRRAGTSKLGALVAVQYLLHVLSLAWSDTENERVFRFALIGASGVVVNLSILFLLHGVLGVHDLLAAAIAIETSIVSNFLLNDFITFRDRRSGRRIRRLLQFNTVSLIALVVNITVYAVLTRGLGVFYLVAQLIGILVAFTANYLGNLHWTYGKPREAATLRTRFQRLLPWIPLLLVTAGAGTLYFQDIDEPAVMLYDERFYVSAARQYQNDVWHDPCWQPNEPHIPINNQHPPFGKLLITWSMHLFDTDDHVFEGCRRPADVEGGGAARFAEFERRLLEESDPVAWRGPAAALATSAVLGIGLAAAFLLRNPLWGAFAAALVALDNMLLVLGRLAMLDAMAAGFAALALAAAARPTRKALALSILLLALGFATKHVVVFIGPAVLAVAWYVRYRAGTLRPVKAALIAAAYPLAALAAFVLSYIPWWRIWIPALGWRGAWDHFVELTRNQLEWAAAAEFPPHPDQSAPAEWFLMKTPSVMVRPREHFDGYLIAIGNPVIWWLAAAAVVVLLVLVITRLARNDYRVTVHGEKRQRLDERTAVTALALIVPLSAYVPFLFLTRPQFLYYMTFVVPFLALPITAALWDLARERPRLAAISAGLVLVAAAILFLHLLPITYRMTPVTLEEVQEILRVIPWAEHEHLG